MVFAQLVPKLQPSALSPGFLLRKQPSKSEQFIRQKSKDEKWEQEERRLEGRKPSSSTLEERGSFSSALKVLFGGCPAGAGKRVLPGPSGLDFFFCDQGSCSSPMPLRMPAYETESTLEEVRSVLLALNLFLFLVTLQISQWLFTSVTATCLQQI